MVNSHSRPVHLSCEASPFSKDSKDQNYRGFLHLALLLLFVNLLRLVIENFRKYGILLSFPINSRNASDAAYSILAVSLHFINLIQSFYIEKKVASNVIRRKNTRIALIMFNFVILLGISGLIVWTRIYHPFYGMFVLCMSFILLLKLISYHLVNNDLWYSWKHSSHKDHPNPYPFCPYPKNITFKNLCYFWLAPTLCYQPTYPRISRIRKRFLLKRISELAVSLMLMHILIEQYALPTIQNSMSHFERLDFPGLLERVLKLSISSLYIWLIGFYALFHSVLNILAELLRFGDRGFYKSWWNANTFEEYWRDWNTPVHQWLKRHVYQPLRDRGSSSFYAKVGAFFISAIVHELIVCIPTRVFHGWAFFAMMLQVPLIIATKLAVSKYPHSSIGNFIFWLCFCILGQPMVVLLYYRAWTVNSR